MGDRQGVGADFQTVSQQEAANIGQQLPPPPLAWVHIGEFVGTLFLGDWASTGRCAKAEPTENAALFAGEIEIMSGHAHG